MNELSADMEDTEEEQWTIQDELVEACQLGDIEVVEDILDNEEVDINGRDERGEIPLHTAARWGHLDIVRRLLEYPGIKINDAGETVLHVACTNDRAAAVVQLLLQDRRCSPSVVNKKDGAGETALMIAVDMSHIDIVKVLDREGTDFFTKITSNGMNHGMSLMGMARMRKNAEVLEYLLERNRVDSLQVIAAHNIARYVKNKDDVEALEIPETVRHFLAGFVDNEDDDDESLDTDDKTDRNKKITNENLPKQLPTMTLSYSQQKI